MQEQQQEKIVIVTRLVRQIQSHSRFFSLDSESEICRDDKSKNCLKASNCHGERPT